ncbi:MAG: DUF4301 family protein [Pseudomonadota bacterium]
MSHTIFNHDDIKQINAIGITEERVVSQIEIFKRKPSYINLNRPSIIGDGIIVIPEGEIQELLLLHHQAAATGRLLKFVPASGAASRMFKSMIYFCNLNQKIDRKDIIKKAGGSKESEEMLSFINGIRQFAFFDDLKSLMSASGFDINAQVDKGQFKEIVDYLLNPHSLDYANLPKGLLKFHQYPDGNRTAFEEHLVEAADYVKDLHNICRLHFTVSFEHQDNFKSFLEYIKNKYENKFNARFQVDFSLQKRSTDTIAVDLENQPFREGDGKLLFRPGGHGALIENLNDLEGDIIYIKNIDNVAPDRIKGPTYLWKKVLAGYLVKLQKIIFNYIERLTSEEPEERFLEEVMNFTRDSLSLTFTKSWQSKTIRKKRELLLNKLNRPLRVCGMVKKVGEPGGGPFWVEGKDRALSLQIIESAQVNPYSKEQQSVFASATHFNPVDIVCGVRDSKGDPFDLRNYVDSDAVFISKKSKDGRDLKALELPGLWNGAMANWNTVFVEVPIITFNPVKTINDLLRMTHQP